MYHASYVYVGWSSSNMGFKKTIKNLVLFLLSIGLLYLFYLTRLVGILMFILGFFIGSLMTYLIAMKHSPEFFGFMKMVIDGAKDDRKTDEDKKEAQLSDD